MTFTVLHTDTMEDVSSCWERAKRVTENGTKAVNWKPTIDNFFTCSYFLMNKCIHMFKVETLPTKTDVIRFLSNVSLLSRWVQTRTAGELWHLTSSVILTHLLICFKHHIHDSVHICKKDAKLEPTKISIFLVLLWLWTVIRAMETDMKVKTWSRLSSCPVEYFANISWFLFITDNLIPHSHMMTHYNYLH